MILQSLRQGKGINFIYQMMYSKSQQQTNNLPSLEEWAVISKRQAEEHERMKEIQKIQQYEKMIKFREGLNDQIKNKGDKKKIEREKDQAYYKYAIQNSKQYNQQQAKQKQEKVMKRKMMEEENNKLKQQIANSRTKNFDSGYLQIGVQSERQKRLSQQKGKKQMIDELERQLREKNEQNLKQKLQEYKLSLEHQRNQPSQFEHHKRVKSKEYRQDPKAYENYARIMMEKRQQQDQLQRRLVDEAAQRKLFEERRRKDEEMRKKNSLSNNMMDSLEEQVKFQHYRKAQQKKVNPEDVSYGFINNIFRQKPATYDKNKYYEDLRKQAEQQKFQKKKLSYMSEQEYKFNRNQLNKIVNGNYAHAQYLDRSLGAIGQNKRVNSLMHTKEDENAEYIKNKLSNIKGNQSYLGRLQNSSSIH